MSQQSRFPAWGRNALATTQAVVPDSLLAPDIAARVVLDKVEANIFVADAGLNIIYINPHAAHTLQTLASEIERAFHVQIADVLGGSIHRFHKDPGRIERILQDPNFRPHHAQFAFGTVTLETQINRVPGPDGGVAGYVVAWADISAKVAADGRAQVVTGRLAETQDKTRDVSTALQSVATAMEQMSTTVNEIARNGSEATNIVQTAVSIVESATTTMADLGSASTLINEVVNTISQIARQTNLLALNATIEAARAGDAGKGFAVVAGEVKDLSGATQTATQRIGELIDNVQALSRAAGGAMTDIAEIVDRVKASQNAVAAAVEEQTVTNREITRNLAQAATQAEVVTADVAAFLHATATA